MKPAAFEYRRPGSVAEALALMAEHGDDARPLAGGQSLLPMMNMRLARPGVLVDLSRLDELATVESADGTLRIGAMVRQSTLLESAAVATDAPLLAQCAPWIGHWVTRNRGTVGGSLAHADARAELPVALVVLGGSVVARSAAGERVIPAGELFGGHFATTLTPDEVLVESRWPVARHGWGYAFEELAQRHGDFALAMVGCALAAEGGRVTVVRMVVGAVGDRPEPFDVTDAVVGGVVDDGVVAEIGERVRAEVVAHDELHASADYQRHVAAVLAGRALRSAYERAVA